MKIATWNVNSLRVRLPHVLDWLKTAQPDILCLQETKMTDDAFPEQEIVEAGYQVIYSGQKTYNGVAVISRESVRDVVTDLPGLDDPQRRFLACTIGELRVIDVYVPNGSEVGSDKYAYKLDWLDKLTRYIAAQLEHHSQLILLGDFNIAPADIDVHDPEEWQGSILCSEQERAALQALLKLGLNDSFRKFDQKEKTYSWWDYRAAAFRRNRGLRIDLILTSDAVHQFATASTVDKEPRKLERPSDHAPVILEF